MPDLRALLDEAAGAVADPVDVEAIVRRAHRRTRNRRAVVGAVAAVALFAVAVPWFDASSGVDVEVGDERAPFADSGRDREPGAPDMEGGPSLQGPDASTPRPGGSGSGGPLPGVLPGTEPRPGSAGRPASSGHRIAFTRSGDVYVAGLDGSDQARLVAGARSPAWSPDGTRLAVVLLLVPDADGGERTRKAGHLAVVDVASGATTVVRNDRGPTDGFAVDSPVWAPDGSRIAFVQRYCGVAPPVDASPGVHDEDCRPDTPRQEDPGGASWSEIRSVRPDGTGERVVATAADTYHESPSFSPDGRRLVYARARNVVSPEWDLYVAAADGSGATNITAGTDSPGSAHDPAWSPDGRWIAFTFSHPAQGAACGGRPSGISLISPDGSEHPLVTDGAEACDSEPAWGPDGTWVVFTRRGDQNRYAGQLWLAAPARSGGSLTQIGPGVEAALRPRTGG